MILHEVLNMLRHFWTNFAIRLFELRTKKYYDAVDIAYEVRRRWEIES